MQYSAILPTGNVSHLAEFKQGLTIISEGWKAEGEAYEIIFSSTNHESRVTSHDTIIQPYPTPPKKLLISDMDFI